MTSLAVTVGKGSLVQLGLSLGDIATLVSLGRTAGNWLTTSSGDNDFLMAICGDKNILVFRRGLIDLGAFNKRWRQDCKLLINGRPQKLDQTLLDRTLDHFSMFTAIMVSVVTVLDTFISTGGVAVVVEQLLVEMVRTTDMGQDLIRAEIDNRIRAWRSAGVMRGISSHARGFRLNLVKEHQILSSLPPISEAPQFCKFLTWLLLGEEPTFNTPSSDVAAVAACLGHVAFDLLKVNGLSSFDGESEAFCVVNYDPKNDIFSQQSPITTKAGYTAHGNKRIECLIVPLVGSEEAVSIFPIAQESREKCRYAWKRGQAAAADVEIQVKRPSSQEVDNCQDIMYSFSSLQSTSEAASLTKEKRTATRQPFTGLISKHAFINSKAMDLYIKEALEEFAPLADWLVMQTNDGEVGEGDDGWVTSPDFSNSNRIEAFSVMQSFFMGYYYQLFGRFIDTASLEIPIVEGNWGFRSTELLTRMRDYCLTARQMAQGQSKTVSLKRQTVIEILSTLFLNQRVHLESRSRFNHCIGIVGKRTLLTASLLRPTDCPNAVGQFVLLDVDTGGIPRDSEGIVRPGESELDTLHPIMNGTPSVQPSRTHPDITRHIEADWAGNRDRLILTFRYQGRRLFSLNSAETDLRVCHSYVAPTDTTAPAKSLPNVIGAGLEDLLDGKLQNGAFGEHAVLFQAHNCPNLRYAAVGIHQSNDVRLASDDLVAALQSAPTELPPVIIATEGTRGQAIRKAADSLFRGKSMTVA